MTLISSKNSFALYLFILSLGLFLSISIVSNPVLGQTANNNNVNASSTVNTNIFRAIQYLTYDVIQFLQSGDTNNAMLNLNLVDQQINSFTITPSSNSNLVNSTSLSSIKGLFQNAVTSLNNNDVTGSLSYTNQAYQNLLTMSVPQFISLNNNNNNNPSTSNNANNLNSEQLLNLTTQAISSLPDVKGKGTQNLKDKLKLIQDILIKSTGKEVVVVPSD